MRFQEKKEECYTPLAVSIGLYHYSDREVNKWRNSVMMVKFVKDPVDNSGAPRKDFYVNVKEELQKARGCYDKNITEKFSDEEFIKMMFIDGCFILQFMHCVNGESEKLEMSDRQIFHVKRDLLLLENQLPFAVLDSLRKQRYTGLSESNEIINNFLSLHIRSSDVKELRSNDVIRSTISEPTRKSHDTYDTAAYNDVKMAINKQCESTVKRWLPIIQDSHPMDVNANASTLDFRVESDLLVFESISYDIYLLVSLPIFGCL
ncbi:hypothetical protein OIU76_021409 [Salix suchowensis]|nr:hypothetical protein OIU76_021409 [Salix suchowensis]